MKIIGFFVNLIYWLWLFLIPTGIMGFLAYYKYYNNPKSLTLPIIIFVTGIILGVFLAELVRRKRGLAYFFSRINASPDFDKFSTSDDEDKASLNKEADLKKNNEVTGRT